MYIYDIFDVGCDYELCQRGSTDLRQLVATTCQESLSVHKTLNLSLALVAATLKVCLHPLAIGCKGLLGLI